MKTLNVDISNRYTRFIRSSLLFSTIHLRLFTTKNVCTMSSSFSIVRMELIIRYYPVIKFLTRIYSESVKFFSLHRHQKYFRNERLKVVVMHVSRVKLHTSIVNHSNGCPNGLFNTYPNTLANNRKTSDKLPRLRWKKDEKYPVTGIVTSTTQHATWFYKGKKGHSISCAV